MLRILRAMRRIQGTAWDRFGYTGLRREERSLITRYQELIEAASPYLNEKTFSHVAKIAEMPDGIRGYEDLKLNQVAALKARSANSMQKWTEPQTTP